jgi:hypothetical protein
MKVRMSKRVKAMRTGGKTRRSNYGEDRLRRFAIAWLRSGNLASAYRESAIGRTSRAKASSARVEGHRMLHDPRTQEKLAELRNRALQRAATSVGEWLKNELTISRFDPAWLFDESGNILPIHEIQPEARAAIRSIEVTEERVESVNSEGGQTVTVRSHVKKIRMQSKDGAQERLARYLGAYNRGNDQEHPIAQLINALSCESLAALEEVLRAAVDTATDAASWPVHR